MSAYAWDILGGGFPLAAIGSEMKQLGVAPTLPPSVEAARIDAMRDLWTGAGLEAVETREITVERTFADFEDVWTISMLAAADGRITYSARANAVKGRLPG